jgi:HTH-type transcriptional regulator/antitoxin HigA
MFESPIILNEREAHRARKMLARIDETLSAKAFFQTACLSLPPDVVNMHKKAIGGSRNTLAAMLNTYEQLRSGTYSDIATNWRGEPGVVLIIARIARGLSQSELAAQLGMREQQVQRYESERYRSISLQNYRRIAAVLGVEFHASVDPCFGSWMPRLSGSDQPLISDQQLKTVVEHARKRRWFDVPDAQSEQRRAVIDYVRESHSRFGSPGLLRTGLKSLDLKDDALLAVWRARIVARAEEAASKLEGTFDQLDISWLAQFVKLSAKDEGPVQAIKMAAQKGIVIVAEPQLPGLKLDGAAFLSGRAPIVGITIRHDRIDNFWFTLLHELAHVYLHYQAGLAAGFFDDDLDQDKSDEIEQEADQFASSILIPTERWRLSTARISRTPGPAEQFAKQLEIHPAIVFGRIRRERGDYSLFSDRVGMGKVRNQLYSS